MLDAASPFSYYPKLLEGITRLETLADGHGDPAARVRIADHTYAIEGGLELLDQFAAGADTGGEDDRVCFEFGLGSRGQIPDPDTAV